MVTRKKPVGPTPVEATLHKDKRANIPTADAKEFVAPEIEEIKQHRYPRDPSLDPQLVWKGKDAQDGEELVVDAPPIYIQEKIDPRVLIENLRSTAERSELEPELTLFDSFDGLDDFDSVDFYNHDVNWANRMILGDSLQVMASLGDREALRGQVQMVYIDPPYGIKFNSNWQASARNRDVSDGKVEDASREAEMIRAFRDTWELGVHSYLSYLRDRLVASRDLLSDSGSLFLQIGNENVHLVRSLLDEVFGRENFLAMITFQKTGGQSSNFLASTVDFILWYGKERDMTKYRQLYKPREAGSLSLDRYDFIEFPDGESRRLTRAEIQGRAEIPPGRRFRTQSMLSSGAAKTDQVFDFDGKSFSPRPGSHWKTTIDGMKRLKTAGRLLQEGSGLTYKRYADDFPVVPVTDRWESMQIGTSLDYVVQTATSVVERCILMATDPGDLVVDPTCGSGTTAFASEQWGRRWITIDTSRVALTLARQRLMCGRFPSYLLADSEKGRAKEAAVTGRPASGGSPTGDLRRGFVCERVPHVTLKSIAQNTDLDVASDPQEIKASVERSSEFEVLVDKPYVDQSVVRVSGPISIESLSPHRSLAFSGDAANGHQTNDSGFDFEQSVLANLQQAGVQNGKRKERLEFDLVEPYAGQLIQAIGIREAGDSGVARVAIALGPQYGTVSPAFIKDAAREAISAKNFDLLCILGFAYDPQALSATDEYISTDGGFDVAGERSLGPLRVSLVRMNTDLLMGDDLKKTGAGNLFTVFGEPDIDLREDDGGFVVEIRGVDVYDPTSGDIRSNSTDDIYLWMIDTNYNSDSFFVRECYFTGKSDPYKNLKRALKAEINQDAWDSLNKTISRSFPKPDTGKIAVKVINDYGDEVMKVFEI